MLLLPPVGCQSIACMRFSNSAEGLNFHLRMIVQMRNEPPTTDAITMMTVIVVFVAVEVPSAAPSATAVFDGV